MTTFTPQNRRQTLKSIGCGFGYLAAAAMAHREASASTPQADESGSNPLAARQPHFFPRAKRVIFLFMQGGPSHVDTFDYKPILAQQDGTMHTFDDARGAGKEQGDRSAPSLPVPMEVQAVWSMRPTGLRAVPHTSQPM